MGMANAMSCCGETISNAMADTEQETPLKNAILIAEETGKVTHRFCTEAEARQVMDEAVKSCGCAISIIVKACAAQLAFELHPGVRQRVDEAKRSLENQIRIQKALDAHGVPQDPELRRSILNAFRDLAVV